MRAVGNVVTGGTGGDGLSLPMQEREDREQVRARMEAKAAARRAKSPFANYRPSPPAPTPPPAPAPAEVEDRFTSAPLVDEPAPTPVPVAAPKRAAGPVPKPGPRTSTPPAKLPARSRAMDVAGIVQDYLAGASVPQIARARGCGRERVRRVLRETPGLVVRDDRATRSGGKKKIDTPGVVELVRRLYVDDQLTQAQIAERLSCSVKVVQGVMSRNHITSRPDVVASGENHNAPGKSTLTGHQAAIAAAGLTPATLRAWALEHGLPVSGRGVPGKAVLAAYQAAQNPTPAPEVEPEPARDIGRENIPVSIPAPRRVTSAEVADAVATVSAWHGLETPPEDTPTPAPAPPMRPVPDPPHLTAVPALADRPAQPAGLDQIGRALAQLAYRFAEALDDFARQVGP